MDDYDTLIDTATEELPEEVIDVFISEKIDTVFAEIKTLYNFPEELISDLKFHFNNYILQIETEDDFINCLNTYQLEQDKKDAIQEKLFETILKPLLLEIQNKYTETQQELVQNTETDTLQTQIIQPTIPNTAPAPVNIWQSKLEASTSSTPTKPATENKTSLPIGIDPYKEIPN